jgi:hypothetical protein
MASWKTHQGFGLFIYTGYAFTITWANPESGGASLLSIVFVMIGSVFPDILDPPNRWKHRAAAHSTTRFKTISILTIVGFFLSYRTGFAIPCTAFLIGYWSHLLADATTASGLPRLKRSSKLSRNKNKFEHEHVYKYVPEKLDIHLSSIGTTYNQTRKDKKDMKIKDIINNKSVEAVRDWYMEDKIKTFPDGRRIRIWGFITREQLIRLCKIYPHNYRVWINGDCKSDPIKEPDVGPSVDLNEAKQIVELVSQQNKGDFIYIDPEISGGWGVGRLKSSHNSRQNKMTFTKLPFELASPEAGQEIIYDE